MAVIPGPRVYVLLGPGQCFRWMLRLRDVRSAHGSHPPPLPMGRQAVTRRPHQKLGFGIQKKNDLLFSSHVFF